MHSLSLSAIVMTEVLRPVTDEIPVVDLSESDEKAVAMQLVAAFRTIGFATLISHGMQQNLFQDAFKASSSFFSLPNDTKLQYKYKGHKSNRGYIPFGSEKFEAGTSAERKETFDIGKEGEPGAQTPWPKELQEFQPPLLRYFDDMNQLFLRLLRLVAIGLELEDESYLVDRCNDQHCNLRLLHYPAMEVPKDSVEDAIVIRGARHTDFGVLTLLTQDEVGGLRAQHRNGQWISVPPTPNSIVVNVGDMLQRWSNDVLVATPHQVINNERNNDDHKTMVDVPERYSIAFFCNANKDVMLKCIEGVSDEDPKYEPINAHEYITQRLAATIGNN